jgi:DNA repair protein RadC
MSRAMNYSDNFYKSLNTLTGIPIKKIQEYAKEHNPFNILEHPMVIDPNERQMEKINKLNEFISNYNLLRMAEEQKRIQFNSPKEAGRYFVSLLGGVRDKERFMVAFLDNSNGIIEARTMTEGSVGTTYVFPREVLKQAMATDCASILLCHNHPSGSTKPSKEDIYLTQRFTDIFGPLDIKVIDHIIVGGHNFSSMAEMGYLPTMQQGKAEYEPIEIKHNNVTNETEQSYGMTFGY